MNHHSQFGKACVMYANVKANLGLFPGDGYVRGARKGTRCS